MVLINMELVLAAALGMTIIGASMWIFNKIPTDIFISLLFLLLWFGFGLLIGSMLLDILNIIDFGWF